MLSIRYIVKCKAITNHFQKSLFLGKAGKNNTFIRDFLNNDGNKTLFIFNKYQSGSIA